jgi:hypothetical protein
MEHFDTKSLVRSLATYSETFSNEKKKKIQHYYESIFEMILTIPTTNYLKKINDYVLKNTKDASFRSNLVITRGD